MRDEFTCCSKRCRTYEPGLLVQLGYDGEARALLFVPEWNDAGRYQGRADIPLSDRGVAEVRALADQLRSVDFDAAYCSTLSRARTTAAILLEGSGLRALPLPDLDDRGSAVSAGSQSSRVRKDDPSASLCLPKNDRAPGRPRFRISFLRATRAPC